MNNQEKDFIVTSAFTSLFPDKKVPVLKLRFSSRFSSFNANVSIHKQFGLVSELVFSLSRDFEDSENEIIIGAIHFLLNKVYDTSVNSLELDLYNGFMKRINRYARKTPSDNFLLSVYHRLNEEYFDGLLDNVNIVWGQASTTTLGHYNFTTNTITISTVLSKESDLLDFVVYHEMLHKKHGFKQNKTRSEYHTRDFRLDEQKFKVEDIDKKLTRFVARKKIKKLFFR